MCVFCYPGNVTDDTHRDDDDDDDQSHSIVDILTPPKSDRTEMKSPASLENKTTEHQKSTSPSKPKIWSLAETAMSSSHPAQRTSVFPIARLHTSSQQQRWPTQLPLRIGYGFPRTSPLPATPLTPPLTPEKVQQSSK